MIHNDKEGILREFRKAPDEFVNFLMENKLLAGDIRRFLMDEISAEPQQEYSKKFSWLLYMPNIVSLVSVDGCCNLACRMCGGSKGKLEYIDSEKLKTIIRHIPTAELITLVAGNSEPLMNPAFEELLKTMSENFVNFSLVTNAHLLKDSIIKMLVDYPLNGDINISLDAVTPETYKNIRGTSNQKVLENLHKLNEQKKKNPSSKLLISFLMVGMEDNIVELPEFVRLASSLGAYRVKVDNMLGNFTPGNFTLNPDWKVHVKRALNAAKETGVSLQLPASALSILDSESQKCESTGHSSSSSCTEKNAAPERKCDTLSSLHINIDGTIHPCCHTMSVRLGNIFEGPLYLNSQYIEARRMNASGKVFPACACVKNCAYINYLEMSGMLKIKRDIFI